MTWVWDEKLGCVVDGDLRLGPHMMIEKYNALVPEGSVVVPLEASRDMCVAGSKVDMVREYIKLAEAEGARILDQVEPVPAPVHDVMLCFKVWRAMCAAYSTTGE